MNAALIVFAANGYRSGSLEDIAREVGVTKPALRYYFPSKGELFAAVLERWDNLAFAISPLDQDDPVEALRGLVRLAEHNLSTPGVVALHITVAAEAVAEGHPAHEYYVQRYAFLVQRLTEIFERCHSRGLLAPHVEPARAARSIAAIWDGLQIQWLTDHESLDLVADFTQSIGDLLTPEAHWNE